MGKTDRVVKAYEFLQECSRYEREFTYLDIVNWTGWALKTARTYTSKYWKTFLVRVSPGKFIVKPEFERISEERFLILSTQKRSVFAEYERHRYDQVVTYEFLLPLTREDELRQALDELFYRDTIRQRLREVGIEKLSSWRSRAEFINDEDYLDEVAELVGQKFGGYSISHVSGRFRAGPLTTRSGAARLLEEHHQYLIDETTASVRFIIPVAGSMSRHGGRFGGIETGQRLTELTEINLIHELFFELFVEPAVRTVSGEDQIWLIEESPVGRSLYVWEKPDLT